MRVAAILSIVSIVGCGSSVPATTTPPIDAPPGAGVDASGASTGSAVESGAVSASAEGAGEQEAYAAAVAALRASLLGEGVPTSIVVHDPQRDGMRTERGANGFVAHVWLDEARVREILDGLASLPPPALPAPFDAPVTALHRAHIERLSCDRRRALFGESCEVPDTAALEAELRTLAGTLRLRSRYDGGVPVGADGRPLRPPAVVLERVTPEGTAQPASGFPLAAATAEGAVQTVSTDETGMAVFAVGSDEALPSAITVTLDRSGLLGPLAEAFPELALRLRGRPVDLRRWAVATTERVAGRASRQPVFANALGPALREHGARRAVALPRGAAERILARPPAERSRAITPLADELGGRVDILLVAEVDSEFASAMGSTRVWFEARGRLEAIDVWTGRSIHAVESSVTAAGVGEARADEAARTELARALVTELVRHAGLLPQREPIARR